jgi:hypothetical protein
MVHSRCVDAGGRGRGAVVGAVKSVGGKHCTSSNINQRVNERGANERRERESDRYSYILWIRGLRTCAEEADYILHRFSVTSKAYDPRLSPELPVTSRVSFIFDERWNASIRRPRQFHIKMRGDTEFLWQMHIITCQNDMMKW